MQPVLYKVSNCYTLEKVQIALWKLTQVKVKVAHKKNT